LNRVQAFKSILTLLGLSGVAYLLQFYFADKMFFYLNETTANFISKSIGTLPLLCIGVILLKMLTAEHNQHLIVLSYFIFFLLLSPFKGLALGFIGVMALLYYLEKFLPRHKLYTFAVLIFILFLLYFPALIYTFKISLNKPQFYILMVYKTCVFMRLVGWFIDRRIYKRTDFSSLWDFLEFMFCPIFFLYQGQIQFFRFRYFHESKIGTVLNGEYRKTFLIGLWGLGLMMAFGWMNYFFWKEIFLMPAGLAKEKLPFYHLGVGVYWLIAIYFQQTAGMSFQVSIARLIGYQIKYDMHYPLLARSPIDYLRRHSSYVRDYVVEMGLRPLALPLMRLGVKPNLVFIFSAILSYAVLEFAQTGYRADFDRSWLVSFVLVAFLCLYLILPLISLFFKALLGHEEGKINNIEGNIENKPIRLWTVTDYFRWAGTMLIVAISKSFLGIAKAISQ